MRKKSKLTVMLLLGTLLFSILTGCNGVVKSPEKASFGMQNASSLPTEEPQPSATPTPIEVTPSEGELLQEKAHNYLDSLNCPVADSDDNRLGLSITSIEKVGEEYKISWECSNPDALGNEFMVFACMHFFDPEDFTNHYQAFTTTTDGQIQYTFGAGDEITYSTFRINFEPDSKIVYLFFEGALESNGAPAEISTQPLFYTLILGEAPMILETAPRLAYGIFDAYLPDTTGTSGIDAATPTPYPTPTLTPSPIPEPVEQPLPENGETITNVTDNTIPLTISTPDTYYYLLKLKDRDTGEVAMQWFIYPDSQIQTDVPYGHYVMQYATGTEWYGEEDLFGPATEYGEFTDDFFFEYDYEYTLELMAQVGGNLNDVAIDPEAFK